MLNSYLFVPNTIVSIFFSFFCVYFEALNVIIGNSFLYFLSDSLKISQNLCTSHKWYGVSPRYSGVFFINSILRIQKGLKKKKTKSRIVNQHDTLGENDINLIFISASSVYDNSPDCNFD